MAKVKIIWSKLAQEDLKEILTYWIERNGTKTYSRELFQQIKIKVNLIAKNNFIGRPTDEENTRVLVSGNYLIFYEVTEKWIEIQQIWDSRRNPEERKR